VPGNYSDRRTAGEIFRIGEREGHLDEVASSK
jgi:hypothetical protein